MSKHPADAEADRKIANASGYLVRFRISPNNLIIETAPTLAEAVAIAHALNFEHGKHGRRAAIYAVQADKRVSEPVKYRSRSQTTAA